MKSDFYLILKTLFVLVILTFLSHLFGYVLKKHVKKAKVNFNIYYVADQTTNITILTLSHISRRKGNQAMEFGQLIKKNKKYFSSKTIQKLRQRDQFQTSFCFKRSFFLHQGMQLSVQQIGLGNEKLLVRLRLLAMCRGELSAVIARLLSKHLLSEWTWQ